MSDRHTKGWDGERFKGFRGGTLWCQRWDVDGDVTLSEWYESLNDVAKHDLLDDWIGLLERERRALHKKMYGLDYDE